MNKKKIYALILALIYSSVGFTQTFEQHIQSSTDDAEEKFDGSDITTSSSDIELVFDDWNDQGLQTIGLRFDNVTIPANSIISNAYIQFTADGSSSGNVSMTIKGEDVANSAAFADIFNNISSRTTTSTEVLWNPTNAWSDNQSGINQRTPDLSTVVTEIITSNGWQNGNPISFIITGTGNDDVKREAVSFDENPTQSAKLVIEYSSLAEVDLAVASIIAPGDFSYPAPASQVQVELFSYGNLVADNYTVSYSLDGVPMETLPGSVSLNLGESTIVTFSQTLDLSNLGTYEISASVDVAGDEDLSNNAGTKSTTVVEEIDDLFFAQGSSWKYQDIGTNPGIAWNSVGFNDDDWAVGLGHMGFGDGDEMTALNGGVVSYYFRKKVDLSDVSQLSDLYMHLIHDDAAIVYINGQEAFRTELMPLGTINHATEARQEANDNNENDFYTYKIDPDLFITGLNTIAVSVRNENSSSANLSFNCYFTTDFQYNQDGPYVYYVGDDIIVEEVTPEGVVSNTYSSPSDIELTCTLPHMNTSFSFPLKTEITIEPSEYDPTPPKFLSISDFDGHIEAFTMILRGEGIIDENFNWTYDNGHLIISGDLFDRGAHITECMWLLYKLEAEALAQGGKVHLVIGNHEMFNLRDDWRYVEIKYFNNAHLMDKRMIELYAANTELGRWLRSKNIMERIGDYAFLHGGISPDVAALNLTFDQINNFGRLEMNGNCVSNNCETVTGGDGVYWYRGMAKEELSQQQVDDFVTGFGVERIIIGHTKGATVRSLYNGRVLAIDMYHVDNFENGFMEALQFELGCFYIFNTTATNQTYTLLDDCDDFTNAIDDINAKGQLQIYPNPTVSTLNVKLPEDMIDTFVYSIISEDGKIISKGIIDAELSSINLLGLVAGKYFLMLQNSKNTITGHFILTK